MKRNWGKKRSNWTRETLQMYPPPKALENLENTRVSHSPCHSYPENINEQINIPFLLFS
jgi:hypothetical protein